MIHNDFMICYKAILSLKKSKININRNNNKRKKI